MYDSINQENIIHALDILEREGLKPEVNISRAQAIGSAIAMVFDYDDGFSGSLDVLELAYEILEEINAHSICAALQLIMDGISPDPQSSYGALELCRIPMPNTVKVWNSNKSQHDTYAVDLSFTKVE